MEHAAIRALVLVLMFLSAPLDGACAQAAAERAVKAVPGRDVRVGIYTSIKADCTSGALPAIRLASAPAHGTVTVKRATLKATNVKQCLAIDVPAFVAFYRAAADFTGADSFQLEITFSDGRKELQLFHVSAASRGQGI